jgi:hypothetical protein
MSALFAKLNLKDQSTIAVLNAPASFEAELSQLKGRTIVRTLANGARSGFAIAFAITQAELDTLSNMLVRGTAEDAVVWIAYPKQSSKRYRCEFNRDSGWTVLGAGGFEPVRMVAIDADWSALRFRRAEFIKTLARDPGMLLSEAGKARVKGRKK